MSASLSTLNPKFFNLHPTLLALERGVLLYPHEIERRLIYADALEEFYVPGKYPGPERAEFIRTQIQLDALGPPRKRVKQVFVRPMGPDYWAAHFSDSYVDYNPPKVGERIDIEPHNRRGTSLPTLYGVLITKIQKDPEGYEDMYGVKQDEKSIPWPGQALREKLEALFRLGDGRGDLPLPPHNSVNDGLHSTPTGQPFTTEIWPSQPGGTMPAKSPRWRFVWRNGFIDYVASSADDWLEYGPYIVAHSPVTRTYNPITSLIGLEEARREAKLDRMCNFCEGKGITLGAGPDRGNPTCTDCNGSGWIVNTSWERK